MKVTLVKVVGEISNCHCTTEYFRVYRLENTIIDPQRKTTLVLKDGEKFFIDRIEQNLKTLVVYLYNFDWTSYQKYWSKKEEFEKVKQSFLKRGWSEKEFWTINETG